MTCCCLCVIPSLPCPDLVWPSFLCVDKHCCSSLTDICIAAAPARHSPSWNLPLNPSTSCYTKGHGQRPSASPPFLFLPIEEIGSCRFIHFLQLLDVLLFSALAAVSNALVVCLNSATSLASGTQESRVTLSIWVVRASLCHLPVFFPMLIFVKPFPCFFNSTSKLVNCPQILHLLYPCVNIKMIASAEMWVTI